MSSHPTYNIAKVSDFLAVPEDRMDDCLREFRLALHAVRHTMNIIRIVAEDQGAIVPDDAIQFPSFTWIDDGEHIAKIQFEQQEGN